MEAAGAPGGTRLIRGRSPRPGRWRRSACSHWPHPSSCCPGWPGERGRLQAVQYPADWIRARQLVDGDQHAGSALLLPWAQYRRYPWNHGEAVFDPWPRLLARPMIWNDALRVGRTTVAAESERARQLSPVIDSAGR